MPNFFRKKEQTSISISAQLTEIVKEICEREGMTVSGFVEQAVKDRVLHHMRDDCFMWQELYQKFFGRSC